MPIDIEALKNLLPFEQFIESFIDLCVREFGEMKARDIVMDVQRSDKANKLLSDSLRIQKRFDHMAFIGVIQTGRRFLLKKADVVCFASVILLENWRVEVGNVIGLSEERYLKEIFFDIISECDRYVTHISGKPNLFERYYQILLNVQSGLVNLIESQSTENDDENKNEDDEDNDDDNDDDRGSNQGGTGVAPIDDLPF